LELEIDRPRDPSGNRRFPDTIDPSSPMAANFVIPTKMKAWVYREHGDVTNVLGLDPELKVPELQEGQVLVKVLAAALNPVDVARVKGVIKLPGFSLPVIWLIF